MAVGDLKFSKSAFVAGETVNLYARDVTPGMPNVTLAKSAVAAADGTAAFTGVNKTMTQHGQLVPLLAVAVGATSARTISALPDAV